MATSKAVGAALVSSLLVASVFVARSSIQEQSPEEAPTEVTQLQATCSAGPGGTGLPLPLSSWYVNKNLDSEQERKLTELLLKVYCEGYDKESAIRDWAKIAGTDARDTQLDAENTAPTPTPENYPGMPDPLNAPIVDPDLPGVVFYAGLTGTSLYATLDKPGGFVGYGCGPSPRCACHSEEFLLYASPVQLLLQASCFFENLSLRWNSDKQTIAGVPGVKIRTKNGPTGFDPNGDGNGGPACLGTGHCFPWEAYQQTLIAGYNYSMAQFRTVVYDWRLGPNEWSAEPNDESSLFETGNFAKWKTMYEELKKQTGRPSYVLTISEGGTIFKTFLQQMEQSWKDEHIAAWFSYSGVFAGSSEMAYSQMSGDSYYPWLVKSATPLHFESFTTEQFRKATEAFPGQAAVSPVPSGNATADNLVLFSTPSRNYTYAEYTVALRDAGLNVTAEVMDSIADTRSNFDDPGVRMFCLYGTGISTPGTMKYAQDFNGVHNTEQPTMIHTLDGDGTVHLSSLDVCNRWNPPNTALVGKETTTHMFQNQSHVGILSHRPAYGMEIGRAHV